MHLKELSVYSYLNSEEADILVDKLNINGIKARKHLIANGENSDIFQVFISKDQELNAVPLIIRFKAELNKIKELNKVTCPKCKSTPPITSLKENISFFKRVLSIGAKTMVCKRCGFEWYI